MSWCAVPTDDGFSLVEALVATSIMLLVIGAMLAVVRPAQGSAEAQAELIDVQQRARVAADLLFGDLVLAGAGPDRGASAGSLLASLAPITPCRSVGGTIQVPCYEPDALTVVYVPQGAPVGTLLEPLSPGGDALTLTPGAECPLSDDRCGFRDGMDVLLFDGTGVHEISRVLEAASWSLRLRRPASPGTTTYPAGSTVVGVVMRGYFLDRTGDILRRDEGAASSTPVVDNLVSLEFRYFGDPQPPLSPAPLPGTANCVLDADGSPRLPVLATANGSLVELPPQRLTDGPWCGDRRPFDADLLRVRKVRVTLRTQSASPAFRGTNVTMFRRPGSAAGGERFIPDFETTFDVAPPNLGFRR
jgi:hypothetical protein